MKFLLAFMLVALSALVRAESNYPPVLSHPQWKEECSSCHMLFPPQYMNAKGWQRLMAGLEHHFGTNAALEPDVNKVILDFLVHNAGVGEEYGSALSHRISNTRWFKSTHGKVPNEAWTIGKVKNRANCPACHIGAERGDWSPVLEDNLFKSRINN